MNTRSSNTIFLGSVMAAIAVCALMASPAVASDPAALADSPTVSSDLNDTVCMDALCYDVSDAPVVVLDMSKVSNDGADTVLVFDRDLPDSEARPIGFVTDAPMEDTVTILGRVATPTSVRTDEYLSTDITNPSNLDLVPRGGAAGLGLKSTF